MRFYMDWRTVRFDWTRVRAFLVTAEEGSLSAAARALGLTQPTVGRQVAALEAELGAALFERGAQGFALTPTGAALLPHAQAMGDAARALSLAAAGRSDAIEGTVRVTASEAVAALFLPPVLRALRAAHPGLEIELVATNEVRDLRRREADVAIRNGAPDDPELTARKIGEATARLYASPTYLAARGPFVDAASLAAADFIGFEENATYVAGLSAAGVDVPEIRFSIRTTSHLAQWEMVKAGLGVGVMADALAAGEPLAAPAAPWLAPFRFPVWLVAHRKLAASRRIRVVFDALAETLRPICVS